MSNNKNDNPQFRQSIGGLTITSEETPHIIMGNPITNTDVINGLQIDIQDKVKTYPKMYYTTDFIAFSFILSKLTLRSSSITNAKLNDTTE